MTTVIEAKRKMRELGTKAQAVVNDTSLTPAEQMKALDDFHTELKGYEEIVSVHESAKRFIAGGEAAEDEQKPAVGRRSFAEQVVDSDGYKSMLNGQSKGVQIEIDTKAAATIDEGVVPPLAGGSGLAGALVLPQSLPGILPLKFQPLTVADLFAQGSTSAAAISYVIEAAFQDLTGTVAEKGKKPQLDLTLARRQDNMAKIANIAKVTDETFQDAEQFIAYLQNRMIFGVKRKEEQQLLNGTGTSPELQGVLNRSGLATTVTTTAGLTAVKAMEGIFNQITALRTSSFIEPDAVVIHPADWQTIRLGKDSQGQYYAGGPFTGAYGNPGPSNVYNIWGIPAVVTTAIAQGTVLVGGFQESGQVWRRNSITVEMTNSNVDDFENNLVTVRAEERVALSIYRPAGFGKVALTA
ncbi:phage major capsid protein [Microbacterium sp. NPDC089698]|uniref:phage major capsid protein n=1 Tax=Microbacterium sp. NPDC089698 TaxID=3364200 RepID=UPI0038147086